MRVEPQNEGGKDIIRRVQGGGAARIDHESRRRLPGTAVYEFRAGLLSFTTKHGIKGGAVHVPPVSVRITDEIALLWLSASPDRHHPGRFHGTERQELLEQSELTQHRRDLGRQCFADRLLIVRGIEHHPIAMSRQR